MYRRYALARMQRDQDDDAGGLRRCRICHEHGVLEQTQIKCMVVMEGRFRTWLFSGQRWFLGSCYRVLRIARIKSTETHVKVGRTFYSDDSKRKTAASSVKAGELR